MDNQRLFLFVALTLVILLLWEAWQKDYGPQPPVATETSGQTTPATPADTSTADVPSAPAAGDGATPAVPAAADAAAVRILPTGRRIHIVTDVLDLEIDTLGGDVRKADLLAYPVEVDQPHNPVRLMNDIDADFFISQSGFIGDNAPTHRAEFNSPQDQYTLADGSDTLEVPLTWTGADGVEVTKRYTLKRGRYEIDVRFEVRNPTQADWSARVYRQLQRGVPEDKGQRFIYTFTGGVLYSPEDKYQKIKFDKMAKEPISRDFAGGWAAMIQHYFVGAWIPEATETDHYYSKVLDGDRYVIGMIAPPMNVAPGSQAALDSKLYIGPKLQDHLAEVAPGLELTVDYGVLTFLAQPIYWMLKTIHGFVGNWGWSIILLTMLIKAAFYKLSETSYKSMANMRKLAPRLAALKERYGDDRQKLNTAMMDMYKKEKINPLGGCLPILVQIPVFIALYWVLLETVEMRQAPFALWLNNLSGPDPYFVLPLLMGISMFIQQKLNPAPPDPMQAKVMMALPVIFTVMFAFFPSGLVLYWVVNNVLSIAQQWVITKRVEASAK